MTTPTEYLRGVVDEQPGLPSGDRTRLLALAAELDDAAPWQPNAALVHMGPFGLGSLLAGLGDAYNGLSSSERRWADLWRRASVGLEQAGLHPAAVYAAGQAEALDSQAARSESGDDGGIEAWISASKDSALDVLDVAGDVAGIDTTPDAARANRGPEQRTASRLPLIVGGLALVGGLVFAGPFLITRWRAWSRALEA